MHARPYAPPGPQLVNHRPQLVNNSSASTTPSLAPPRLPIPAGTTPIREIQDARDAKRREKFLLDEAEWLREEGPLRAAVQAVVASSPHPDKDAMLARVYSLFEDAHARRSRRGREVPPAFICPISLCIMRDPVCTPAGVRCVH